MSQKETFGRAQLLGGQAKVLEDARLRSGHEYEAQRAPELRRNQAKVGQVLLSGVGGHIHLRVSQSRAATHEEQRLRLIDRGKSGLTCTAGPVSASKKLFSCEESKTVTSGDDRDWMNCAISAVLIEMTFDQGDYLVWSVIWSKEVSSSKVVEMYNKSPFATRLSAYRSSRSL